MPSDTSTSPLVIEATTHQIMRGSPRIAWHQPVMGAEVLELLQPRPGATIVDATAGDGGHSLMLLPRLLPNGRLIAVDQDGEAVARARERLAEFTPIAHVVHDDFRNLPQILHTLGLSRIDGLVLDLGMSNQQLERAERGFSFSHEGPLDMRMDARQTLSAAELVNTASAEALAAILERFGEERFARRIARRIVEARRQQPITTTTQLVHVIIGALPPGSRHGRVHAATRTFQALRIAVNDELGALETCLGWLADILNPGARAVIITFHSLEDRPVKRRFAEGARDGTWTLLTKKPLHAGDEELARNPRARSAKLRAVERRSPAVGE